MSQDFKLVIHMGNDAMKTVYDISKALEHVAFDLGVGSTNGIIKDDNGNTVGHYHIEEK